MYQTRYSLQKMSKYCLSIILQNKEIYFMHIEYSKLCTLLLQSINSLSRFQTFDILLNLSSESSKKIVFFMSNLQSSSTSSISFHLNESKGQINFSEELLVEEQVHIKRICCKKIRIFDGMAMYSMINKYFQQKIINQMWNLLFTLALFFGIMLPSGNALCPTQPTVSTNYKYSFIGKNTIDFASQIPALNRVDWSIQPLWVTITYPQSLVNQIVRTAVALNDYSATNILQGLSVMLQKGDTTGTTMLMKIYSENASNIVNLAFSYLFLLMDSTYNQNFMMIQYQKSFKSSTLSGVQISNLSASFYQENYFLTLSYFNITNSSKGLVVNFLSGINAAPINSSLILDINCTATLTNNFTLFIQIFSTSSTPTLLKQISYLFILYNQDGLDYKTGNYFSFQSSAFSSSSSHSLISDIMSFNFLIGLASFRRSNSTITYFNVSIQVANNTVVSSTQGINKAVFSYLSIYSKYCDYRTPYLYSPYQYCFDSCSSGTAASDSSLECSGTANQTLDAIIASCSSSSSSQSTPIGLIVGASVGGTVFLAIVIIIIYRKCKQPPKGEQQDKMEDPIQSSSNIIPDKIKNSQEQKQLQRGFQNNEAENNKSLDNSEKVKNSQTTVTGLPQSRKVINGVGLPQISENVPNFNRNQPLNISHNLDIYALQGFDNLSIASSIPDLQQQANNQYNLYGA